MLQKKDILELAESMNIEPDYEKFYRFMQNFTMHLSKETPANTEQVFELLEYSGRNLGSVKTYFGISGNNTNPLKFWLNYMHGRKTELQKLSMTELNYVFACCARLCKAKQP